MRIRRLLLPLRLNLDTVIVVTAMGLFLTVAMLLLASGLRAYALACGQAMSGGGCEDLRLVGKVGGDRPRQLLELAGLTPMIAGAALGAPLLSRDLERGTARFMWSIARSRIAWLVWAAAPIGIAGALVMVGLGLASNELESATSPLLDPGRSMDDYGLRGLLLPLRYGVAFVASAVIGLLIGRALPALLVSITATFGMLLVLAMLSSHWLPPTVIVPANTPIEDLGVLHVETRFVREDGSSLSLEEARQIDPELSDPALGRAVAYGIRGDRFGEVQAREGLGLVTSVLVLGGLGVVVLRRRRP